MLHGWRGAQRQFDTTLLLACQTAAPDGTESVDLSCVVDRVSVASGRHEAPSVLAALEQRISDAHVLVSVTSLGRVGRVDIDWRGLDPMPADDLATVLLTRAVAGFDLELPTNPLLEQWEQRRSAFSAHSPEQAAVAGARLDHERIGTLGSMAFVRSTGTLQHLVLNLVRQPDREDGARLLGLATFDTAEGLLTQRSWTLHDLGYSPYDQRGALELVGIRSPLIAFVR